MMRKMPVLLFPLVLLCPSLSHGDATEPSNYDECILDAMRGVSSDVAAQAIIDSCRNLFPETPQAAPPAAAPAPLDTTGARDLTADELGLLRATAKVFGDAYRVTVVNNNSNLTLTEVTIAVWDDNDGGATRQEYSEAVQIGPQSSELVKYTVRYRGDETGWRWDVVAARGVE
jgi:hypothetical protein